MKDARIHSICIAKERGQLKKEVEEKMKKEHQAPNTHEISILAKYQQMIEGLVDEVLMKEILQKI